MDLAEAVLASADLERIKQHVASEIELLAKPRPGLVFQLARDTKTFQVHQEDAKKTVTIEGDLSEYQEAELVASLRANWAYFPGSPPICQEHVRKS